MTVELLLLALEQLHLFPLGQNGIACTKRQRLRAGLRVRRIRRNDLIAGDTCNRRALQSRSRAFESGSGVLRYWIDRHSFCR